MAKKDALETYNDCELLHLQVIYLNHYKIPLEKIAEITHYAITTIKTYIVKFAHLLKKAIKTFYHITEDTVRALKGGTNEYAYLFKFYNTNNTFCFSKIGEIHKQSINRRLAQEENEYNLEGSICSVIDCGDIPAVGLESYIRSQCIKKYPKSYIPNDRFSVNIDIVEFEQYAKEYLGKNYNNITSSIKRKIRPSELFANWA